MTTYLYSSGFILVFFKIVNKIFESSSASANRLSYNLRSIYPVSCNSDNQYFDSRLSLYEIDSFAEKSAIDTPPFASATFAPILVPERINCFDNTNSLFSSVRNLNMFTIRIAKAYAYLYKLLSGIIAISFYSYLFKTYQNRTPYKN